MKPHQPGRNGRISLEKESFEQTSKRTKTGQLLAVLFRHLVEEKYTPNC